MKVRFTDGRIRVRIDDLELAALGQGHVLRVQVPWSGGGWSLTLDPLLDRVIGDEGRLRVGVKDVLEVLDAPEREGVTISGPPKISVEKDYGPQHA
ncbi:hypothetical protein E7T09_16915 [Deinococcus sp. KSM4-11]|uniref:hypothetical protein n=1 Tax=Deinococcus sp. KSM4-11 TaxID=2568654 RepID=UPI0010A5450E|nr:hypothetical protein [Deinococcus sp. KSM4-11]THF85186.1 hypothetical protein E7T09_16915 [Deinococcus sp. KSM4-11]